MAQDKFELTVTGITRQEYLQASGQNAKRAYRILAVSMLVLCGVIMLATQNVTLKAILWPVGIFAAVVIVWEVLVRVTYKGQLEECDPVVYQFDPLRWTVTAKGKAVEVDWRGTTKLRKTHDCIFLYNDDASCNLLPRRLMTTEQEGQLLAWFQGTRALAREYQHVQDRKARAAYRAEHQSLRDRRRGPAWGPMSKKGK